MRNVLLGFTVLAVGYLVGAVLGYFAIQQLSANTHDRGVEASMTGAFVTGPLLAVIAFVIWLIARRASRA